MTTEHYPVTDEWVQCASGPNFTETDNRAMVHYGSVAPPADTKAFHPLGGDDPKGMAYTGTKNTYVRKNTRDPSFVVVTEMD